MNDSHFLEIENEVLAMETELDNNPDYVNDTDNFDEQFYAIVDNLYELRQVIRDEDNKEMKRYDALCKRLREIAEENAVFDNGHLADLYEDKSNYQSTSDTILESMFPDGQDE